VLGVYFECRINKNALFQTFLGDFAYWEYSVRIAHLILFFSNNKVRGEAQVAFKNASAF